MNSTGCLPQICAKKPAYLFYQFAADRLIQTALIILTLMGVINRTGFLIAAFSLVGVEALSFALLCRGMACTDSKTTSLKWALGFFCVNALLPFITLMGGMHYKACAWSLTGFNVSILSAFLVGYGIKKKIEDDNVRSLRFGLCGC